MMLRFFLVSVVAALGLDLPKGIDMDAWTHSGRTWWHARVSEFEARHGIVLAGIEGTTSPDRPVEPQSPAPDADEAFATVIEDVVASFAVDGASDRMEDPEVSTQLVAGVADATFGPEFADALNRWADGLSEPAEPAMLADEAGDLTFDAGTESIDAPISGFAGSAFASTIGEEDGNPVLVSSADPSADDADEPEGAEPSGSAGPRLSLAVQLTGQALQAWLALVQLPAGPTVPPAL